MNDEALKPKIVCHAEGDRCHGCAHYRGEADVCEYARPEARTAQEAAACSRCHGPENDCDAMLKARTTMKLSDEELREIRDTMERLAEQASSVEETISMVHAADCTESLFQHIEALKAEREWQPIETAPRSGVGLNELLYGVQPKEKI